MYLLKSAQGPAYQNITEKISFFLVPVLGIFDRNEVQLYENTDRVIISSFFVTNVL